MNIDEVGGWFPQENRTKLDELIDLHHCKSGIEIGSFLGLSAIWLAFRLERLQCLDTWCEEATEPNNNNLVATLRRYGIPRDFLRVFLGNVLDAGLMHKVTPIVGRSQEVHGQVVDADLVYIDGSHTYEDVRRDIELYAPKARKVICGDDYVERDGFGVIRAVTELLPSHQHVGQFWWALK
jgi:predicted O-methyltransferase YrrM